MNDDSRTILPDAGFVMPPQKNRRTAARKTRQIRVVSALFRGAWIWWRIPFAPTITFLVVGYFFGSSLLGFAFSTLVWGGDGLLDSSAWSDWIRDEFTKLKSP